MVSFVLVVQASLLACSLFGVVPLISRQKHHQRPFWWCESSLSPKTNEHRVYLSGPHPSRSTAHSSQWWNISHIYKWWVLPLMPNIFLSTPAKELKIRLASSRLVTKLISSVVSVSVILKEKNSPSLSEPISHIHTSDRFRQHDSECHSSIVVMSVMFLGQQVVMNGDLSLVKYVVAERLQWIFFF